jgi:hypothetical protein
MGWRKWAYDFLGTDFGRGAFAICAVLILCIPAFIWRIPGAMLVIGLVLGFLAGYWYARKLWRKNGYVPKYEDLGR